MNSTQMSGGDDGAPGTASQGGGKFHHKQLQNKTFSGTTTNVNESDEDGQDGGDDDDDDEDDDGEEKDFNIKSEELIVSNLDWSNIRQLLLSNSIKPNIIL